MVRRAKRDLATALLLAVLAGVLATASDGAVGFSEAGGPIAPDATLLAQAHSGDAEASEVLFADDLVAALAAESRGNLTVSPVSVFEALARLAPGARGATERMLLRALHSAVSTEQLVADVAALDSRLQGDGATLRIASAAWLQDGFPVRDEYVSLLSRAGSPPRSADFERDPEGAREAIDGWVSENTEGRIDDLFPPGSIDTLTRLVLANALALDAQWQTPFPKQSTTDAQFHTPSGWRSVPTMHLTTDLEYLDAGGFRAVRIPYKGPLDAMVVLPDEGVDPLVVLPQASSPRAHAEFGQAKVNLSLPRFTVDQAIDLARPFAALGLGALFGNPDLFGIGGAPGQLALSAALHRAWLSVDEAGTKGAAATGLSVGISALIAGPRPQPVDFTVDRPFLFVVEDATSGVPVFVARVTDPRS